MPQMVMLAMDIIHLTGLRPGDVLALSREHLTDDGILVTPEKTRRARPDGTVSHGKPLLIEWSAELKKTIDDALREQPQFRRVIICNRSGKPYTTNGFNSIWHRYMRKAVEDKANALVEPFQFRDLRAKSASDDTVEAASARLGHSSTAFTDKVYRRKPTRVRPLR